MVYADLMPDELALGYLGRLRTLNGWRDPSTASSRLHSALQKEHQSVEGRTNVALLALAAKKPVDYFLRFHSMLPFRFAASEFGSHLPYGSPLSAGTEHVYGLALATNRLFACRKCAAEDVKEWGYSWYRRAHQLPGIEHCDRHQSPLSWIDAGDPSGDVPHIQFGRDSCRDYGRDALHHQLSRRRSLARYQAACAALLDKSAPVDSRVLNQNLAARAKAMGMGVDSASGERKLRRALLAIAGESWLSRHFPKISGSSHLTETKIGRLFSEARCIALGAEYGLLVTVLFDDVDEAMSRLFGARTEQLSCDGGTTAGVSGQPIHCEF